MTIDFYFAEGSPPCVAVQLVVKALNIPVNIKNIDMEKGEHLTPQFVKLNPQHTVPTLVDDGFIIWDSHAIITYLANKYGKGSSLYPAEPKARALVDQRLYFDIGSLYEPFVDYYFPQSMAGAPSDPEKKTKVENALKLLDGFLEGQKYVAGPNLTLADLSLIASVSIFPFSDVDFKKHANINRWYKTIMSTAPGCEEIIGNSVAAIKEYVEIYKVKLSSQNK